MLLPAPSETPLPREESSAPTAGLSSASEA